MSCDGVMAGQVRDQAAGVQEILRKLAMVHEGLAQDKARLGLDLTRTSALDPKTAALIVVGAVVAIGASSACLRWSTSRALAAGASADEITGELLGVAPVVRPNRLNIGVRLCCYQCWHRCVWAAMPCLGGGRLSRRRPRTCRALSSRGKCPCIQQARHQLALRAAPGSGGPHRTGSREPMTVGWTPGLLPVPRAGAPGRRPVYFTGASRGSEARPLKSDSRRDQS